MVFVCRPTAIHTILCMISFLNPFKLSNYLLYLLLLFFRQITSLFIYNNICLSPSTSKNLNLIFYPVSQRLKVVFSNLLLLKHLHWILLETFQITVGPALILGSLEVYEYDMKMFRCYMYKSAFIEQLKNMDLSTVIYQIFWKWPVHRIALCSNWPAQILFVLGHFRALVLKSTDLLLPCPHVG